jgi:hypothetical protein
MPEQVRLTNVLLTCLPVLLAVFAIGEARAGSTPTTTLLASSANPSVFGATVTLTAAVTANPPATGNVTFYDAANILGIGTLNGSGVATLNTIMIQAGNRNLRATYSGDASYASSTSTALPQVVHTVGGNSFTFKGVFPVHSASTVVNIATGDFNRDGTPDIVYPSYYTNDVSVLIGDGTGGFAPAVNYPVGGPAALVAAADFNGDGKLDLFCKLDSTAPYGQILFGNGDGTFQPAIDVANVPAGRFFQIAVGDFDGNGTVDIALQNGGGIVILLGNGNGTFIKGTTVNTGAVSSVAVGDFRGIGRADLASGGTIGEMFLNDGGGTATFTSVLAPSLPNPANNPVIFAYIADLHGTGHEDLITGSGEYDLHVVQSNGDGTFQTPRVYGPAPYARSLAAGDFDGDGNLDIITYGTGGWDPNGYSAASVLYNNGDGTFKSSVQVFGSGSCISTNSIIVADFNHDGIADFATADGFNGVCVWLGSANPALAATTTTSMDVTVPYQAAGEPFQMSATVTSPGGIVNGGNVNFIVPYFLSERSNSATVSNGVATAQVGSGGFPFDVGVYNGYVTYYGASGFAASGAQPVRIIVTGTPTTTTASAASVSFSGSAQNVTLRAMVTSDATVNTGSVTFFVTGIGSVSGNVTNGMASAVLGIPGGQAVGTYAINAVYTGVTPLGDSSDNSKSLTISGSATTTTASAASATFSPFPHNVTLNAAVTGPNGVVNGGTVTFTVQGIGIPTLGLVFNGAASATLTIPAGQATGSYAIQATYSGTSNLSPSSDSTQSLVISPPAALTTTTTVLPGSATFSSSAQTVPMLVTVTSTGGTVNGGTVAITVTGVGTATSGAVSNGGAFVTLSIPAGQAPGSYAINAVYSGNGTFGSSSDSSKSLVISKATTTTMASGASTSFSPSAQSVTLNATVTSSGAAVNGGTVSFTVPGVGTATSGTVANGAASATLTILAGQAGGTYTIQAVYSGTTNLNTSSDSSQALVISAPVTTTTTASAATATFNASSQTVTLSASVNSTAGTVNGGTVAFTVTGVGTATSGTVTGGAASATLTIPAGQAAGSYAINAVYSGNGTVPASSDGSKSLVISKASTTTTASGTSANFSASPQIVTLNATVTSPTGTVNSGTVSFTLASVGSATSGTVANGAASATLTIPAGQAGGTYTIQAIYSGTANLNTSSDSSHSLVVTAPASTTTSASAATATFSPTFQAVTLNASVTSTAGAVNGGTVAFTVTGVGTSTSGTVTNGAASATVSIPAGQAPGSYAINAVYSGNGTFNGSSDGSKSLVISPPLTTTTTAASASATFNPSAQTVTLNASVTSTAGTVNGGTVAFAVSGVGMATSGIVANGAASATLTIPAGQALGSYAISAVYSGNGTFPGSSDGSKSLVISQASTTTTASAATAHYSTSAQTVTLNATVTSPIGAVNSGSVTFTVPGVGSATSGTVSNGAASATLTIPAGQGAGTYVIQAVYSGTNGLNTSSDNSKSFAIVVTHFTSPSAATFVVGQPTYLYLSVDNLIPKTFDTVTGALPSGVTLQPYTGIFGGIPAAGTEGVYPLTFAATINGVAYATQSFTLTVGPWVGPVPSLTITHGPATAECAVGFSNAFYVIRITITDTIDYPSFGPNNLAVTLGGGYSYGSRYDPSGSPQVLQFDQVFDARSFPASGSTSVLQVTNQIPGLYYLNYSAPPIGASSTARIALPPHPTTCP